MNKLSVPELLAELDSALRDAQQGRPTTLEVPDLSSLPSDAAAASLQGGRLPRIFREEEAELNARLTLVEKGTYDAARLLVVGADEVLSGARNRIWARCLLAGQMAEELDFRVPPAQVTVRGQRLTLHTFPQTGDTMIPIGLGKDPEVALFYKYSHSTISVSKNSLPADTRQQLNTVLGRYYTLQAITTFIGFWDSIVAVRYTTKDPDTMQVYTGTPEAPESKLSTRILEAAVKLGPDYAAWRSAA